jgi:hypothetical protein
VLIFNTLDGVSSYLPYAGFLFGVFFHPEDVGEKFFRIIGLFST